MDEIIQKLSIIVLDNPFPYRDIDKIQDDFHFDFNKLADDEDSLVGDFNTYCMNIAGTRSYVLTGKMVFFEMFRQYKFIEDRISDYKEFYQEYKRNEEARMLLLMYLSKRKGR
ncbi:MULTISPECIES: YxiJ family protein [unclassified Paenibacillus]|uniref:YxiJ family protein n=1 Tax=unclassified Paenibacillus TaxID=185978 RepID=UPI003625107A